MPITASTTAPDTVGAPRYTVYPDWSGTACFQRSAPCESPRSLATSPAVVTTPLGVSAGSLSMAALVARHATGNAGVAGALVADTTLGATKVLHMAITAAAATITKRGFIP